MGRNGNEKSGKGKPFVDQKQLRREVAAETRSYFPEILSCSDKLEKAIKDTRYYAATSKLPDFFPKYETKYRVINGDTIDIALKLKEKENLNYCVLNMASEKHPGGGWDNGASAQEEALFMRSTYCMSLEDPLKVDKNRRWSYPIQRFGGIYSPNVLIFRDSPKYDYDIWKYKDCKYLDFVAVAAIRHPRLVNGKYSQVDRAVMEEKVRTILRISTLHGHKDLLLSAFGCGAFGNPPVEVTDVFLSVFAEEEFKGRFRHIDFAILDTRNEGNFKVFKEKFAPSDMNVQ